MVSYAGSVGRKVDDDIDWFRSLEIDISAPFPENKPPQITAIATPPNPATRNIAVGSEELPGYGSSGRFKNVRRTLGLSIYHKPVYALRRGVSSRDLNRGRQTKGQKRE